MLRGRGLGLDPEVTHHTVLPSSLPGKRHKLRGWGLWARPGSDARHIRSHSIGSNSSRGHTSGKGPWESQYSWCVEGRKGLVGPQEAPAEVVRRQCSQTHPTAEVGSPRRKDAALQPPRLSPAS